MIWLGMEGESFLNFSILERICKVDNLKLWVRL